MSTTIPTRDVIRTRSSTRSSSRAHTPAYRLTRRGRLVLLALAVTVVLAAMVAIAGGSVATSTEGGDVPTETVLVAPGDTLWEIASDAVDGGDVRGMMTRIEQLNGLVDGQVDAGERIFVPVD